MLLNGLPQASPSACHTATRPALPCWPRHFVAPGVGSSIALVVLALLFAAAPAGRGGAADEGPRLAEQRAALVKRCQRVLPSIRHLPLQQKKELALLLGTVEALLQGARSMLLGGTPPGAPLDAVVSKYLEDADLLLTDVRRCVEAAQQKQPCVLSADSQATVSASVARADAFLKDLPRYCRE
jgi:hypothetical protein